MFSSPTSEAAYLFRHALLRDAAYQLQLPGDRARLHGLALSLLEQAFGGRPAEPEPLDTENRPNVSPHPIDPLAVELAQHAEISSKDDIALRRLYLRRAAEHAERSYQTEASAARWKELAELLSGDARGVALRRAGQAIKNAGRPVEAEGLYGKALEIHRRTGNRALEGTATGALALVYKMTGRLAQGEDAYGHALALHRAAGHRLGEAQELVNLGAFLTEAGRVREAEDMLRRALAPLRELGNTAFEALALANLGTVCAETSRNEESEAFYRQAADLLHRIGDRRGHSVVLGNLALLRDTPERAAETEQVFRQVIALHREFGNRRVEGMMLGNLANLQSRCGRAVEARKSHALALSLNRETGNRRSEGIAVANIAAMDAADHLLPAALEGYQRALAIHREVGNRRSEAVALESIAEVRIAWREFPEAQGLLEAALALHCEVGNRRAEATANGKLALVLLERGRPTDAATHCERALAAARALGDVELEKRFLGTLEKVRKRSVAAPWTADIEIAPDLARALIEEQFPGLAPAALEPFGEGWDNAAFLVNATWVFRFPRRAPAVPLLEAETRLLPGLAGRLPVRIPAPEFVGTPSKRFPYSWAGYRLIPGTTADRAAMSDAQRAAIAPALGAFLRALHAVPVAGLEAPPDTIGRMDVARRRLNALEKIAGLRARVPIPASLESALEGVPESAAAGPCLVHGDLYARHVLVDDAGRATGVIDWGDVHVGDPAVDLMLAFQFLPAAARPAFFAAYGRAGDATLRRARFRAAIHALAVLPYALERGDEDLEREITHGLSHICD
jgi:aminoglycoside phosphotransferase (APT) family kinase protein